MQSKQYKLRVLPEFTYDLQAIFNYILYDVQDSAAADNFLDSVKSSVNKYLKYPEIFAPVEIINVQGKVFRFYRILFKSYIIFYTVEDEIMILHRIVSSRRDFTKLFQ